MSDTVRWTSGQAGRQETKAVDGANLADILERVLDKGIVIAGDIQVNLLDIELLTIKIRLVVASVDRAKEMGIDWWERDPTLSAGRRELEDENDELRSRIAALEAAMDRNPAPAGVPADGDLLADGDLADGDLADGDLADGDLADGDLDDGDLDEEDLLDEQAPEEGEEADDPEPVEPPAPRRGRSRNR